jgi:glycosyltransferase involved in cell wall biosynthesis
MNVLADDLPLFSIATPTRNALDKLRRCVGSVRGQTGVRFEHLVQDAKSSDGSAPWLAEQAQTQASLLQVSEADAGMYDAINRAWDRSQGQYLSWLNADEQYLPGTLARVHRFFESHPAVDVLFADYLVADEQGRAVALRREIGLRKFYVVNTFLNAQSCTLFYRRKLWDEGVLKLDSRFRYAADKDLILRLLARGVRFQHLPEVLSVFGVDGSNLSAHPQMEQEAEAVRLAFGGFAWRPARLLAYTGRRVERLVRGAYWRVDLRYRYALDEAPHYADYLAENLGGRYALTQTRGSALRIDSDDLATQAAVVTQRRSP